MTVALLGLALLSGCERKLPEVYPAEGNAYMNDPAFRAALHEKEKVAQKMTAARVKVNDALKKLLDKLGSSAAVTNTPEGLALYREFVAGEAAFASNRMAIAALLRERMLRAVKDSELIKAGKAKAVKILTDNDLKK